MKIGKYINKKFRLNIFSKKLFMDLKEIYKQQKLNKVSNDDVYRLVICKMAEYIDEDPDALHDVLKDYYEHIERNMKNKKYYIASFDSDDVLMVETSYRFLRNITPEVFAYMSSYLYYKDVVTIISNIERIIMTDNKIDDYMLPKEYKHYVAKKFLALSYKNLSLNSILMNFFYVNKNIVRKKLLLTLHKIKNDIEYEKV